MSILARAAEISATLDPTLGLELEQEFGDDWRAQLSKAIETAGVEQSNPMLEDVKSLSQADFVKKYKKTDSVTLAKGLGVATSGNETEIVARIYEKMMA